MKRRNRSPVRRLIPLMLAALLCLTAAACSPSAPPVKPVTDGFTCTVDITYPDMTMSGILTRTTDEVLSLEMTEPDGLHGLLLRWDGDALTATLGNVSVDLASFGIPDTSIGRCITTVLDQLDAADGVLSDDGLHITGNSDYGAFEVVAEPNTGLPLMLTVPDLSLEVHFRDTVTME